MKYTINYKSNGFNEAETFASKEEAVKNAVHWLVRDWDVRMWDENRTELDPWTGDVMEYDTYGRPYIQGKDPYAA